MYKTEEVVLGRRKRVSDLIFAVLTEKIRVLDALKSYPQYEDDKSLEAMWHALVHYDADEDIRKRDFEYAKVQDDFLEFAAFKLAKGQDLPANIIANYTNFYTDTLAVKKHGIKDFWGIFSRYLNISKTQNKKNDFKVFFELFQRNK